MDLSVFLCTFKCQHWAFILIVRYRWLTVNFLVLWLTMILPSFKIQHALKLTINGSIKNFYCAESNTRRHSELLAPK